MSVAARHGLVGVGALAVLSAVHLLRSATLGSTPALKYVLGVLPNIAAAVAIPFVISGIWAETRWFSSPVRHRLIFHVCLAVSTAGLVIWEFVQRASARLVFDSHDIAGTILGALVALGVFHLVSPVTSTEPASARSPTGEDDRG